MKFRSLFPLCFIIGLPVFAAPGAGDSERRPSPTVASLPAPAAADSLRILLVDDDLSDNNHTPGDNRLSPSDRIFRQLVADAVGGDANAWSIEIVKPYANGPGMERLRKFPLVLWYTGASYGGNPDNTAVLSIEDEKTVRRYLEATGGVVVLVSPGYVSKVLGAEDTWENAKWPFLTEVLGIRGGHGLAQRFLPGTVTASDGARFNVGKGGAVESQFSLVNPDRAAVLFTTLPAAAKGAGSATPVATAHAYGRGRIIYVGFTFENLAEQDLAPAFRQLLAATGPQSKSAPAVAASAAPQRTRVGAQDGGPATVQVSGTPTTAVVSWTMSTATVLNASPAGPSATARKTPATQAPASGPSVIVERLVPNATPMRLNIASSDASKADDPGPLTPGQAVTYRVTVTDPRGVSGSREASFTPPLPQDPASLRASVQADGSVILNWPEVPGVTSYQITHTSRKSAPVIVRRATEWRSPKLDVRISQWAVASVYEPGGTLTPWHTWPTATAEGSSNAGLPTPRVQFLSLPNGAGSNAASEAHYRTRCADALMPGSLCKASGFIAAATNWEAAWQAGGARAVNNRPQWPTAIFDNLLELGSGRRVNCAPRKNGSTVCWATSHVPGTQVLGSQPKSLTLIIMEDDKAFFGNWEYEGNELPGEKDFFSRGGWGDDRLLDMEHNYANRSNLTSGAAFDSQGRKGVPHACLSCHGGTYNPVTKQVTGASLLPVVPARVRVNRQAEEESIRRINQIILQSNPAPGIVDQINAMYNGAPNTPGATANDTAVPSGWSQQTGLYRQVVGPHCASCHVAQRGPFNFRSWGNMLQNKNAVQKAVCQDFTMPHSEILFRKFWTEGIPGSLPGLLSTSLGFSTCRQ